MIRAGGTNRYGTIETATASQSGSGAPTYTWATFATAWFQMDAISARETERYGSLIGDAQWTLQTRYIESVTSQMRVVIDGRTFPIRSVINPRDARVELLLFVSEEV